jgi:hypothetical protein
MPSIADGLLARLPGPPDVYPQNIELARELVLLVLLDAKAYREASFLDDRILSADMAGAWVPAAHVEEASRKVGNPRPLHFIFHTGHVGSTLVSRLLDETGSVFSLREPLPLRVLAEAHDRFGRPDCRMNKEQFNRLLRMFLRLWRRGYDATHGVVVKATSSAGRLAGPLLDASERSGAVYLNLRAEPYLATLLAGENSPIDLRGHGPERLSRLQRRVGGPLPSLETLSLGELAAMSWLAESWTRHDALEQYKDRVLGLDFDRFLADVPAGIGRVLDHFGLPRSAAYLSSVAKSAVLTRYSKAPQFEYSPGLREEILRESRRDHRDEIRRGMNWLERQARANGAVAEIIAA